jgi:hypothetical protein
MKQWLRMFAALALLISARAFAYDDPGCRSVVWSAEHNHYHCVDDVSPQTVYETAPAGGPRVYVGLSYNAGYAYPYYRPRYYGPRFYARPYFAYAPRYYAPRYSYGPYWGHYHYRHWW